MTWPARVLGHFFAFLYPAYQSFKAVRENSPEKHAQWLTYWIVNSYFIVFELLSDSFLSWIPFYHEVKLALLIWLVTPRFNGAEKIYKQVIHPYLLKYEESIDNNLAQTQKISSEKLDLLKDVGVRHLRSSSSEVIKMGQSIVFTGLLSSSSSNKEE